jgi:hypothetical protein
LYCSTRWHTNHTLIVYFTSWKYGIIQKIFCLLHNFVWIFANSQTKY